MQALFQQAQQAMQARQFAVAIQRFHQVLQKQPTNANALHLLGICYSQQGQHQEALQYISKAIQQQTHPMYYHNLGRVYLQMNNLQQALGCFRMATNFAPHSAESWFMLANTLKKMGRFKEAQQKYKKAINADPKHVMTLYNWGNLLLETGRYSEAKEKLQTCISLDPTYVPAFNNLGSVWDQLQESERAAQYFKRALKKDPNYVEARRNLASNFEKRGYFKEAQEQLQTLLKQQPDNRWLQWQINGMLPMIYQSNAEIDQYRQTLQNQIQTALQNPPIFNPEIWQDHSPQPPFICNYQGRFERPLKEKYGRFWENYFQKIRQQLQQSASIPSKMGKALPHIGFVVTNGHEGVFLKCMRGIVEHLDRKRFRLTIVCSYPAGQPILSQKIKRKDIEYLSLPKKMTEVVTVLQKANFDLLHYWEVGTDFTNYFLPYFRLAKVQSMTWGTPVTSGIPQMDYYVSSKFLETPDSQNHYTEKLIELEHLPTCYYPPKLPSKLKTRIDFQLPPNVPLYACVQNLRKVHPDMDVLFKEILKQDTKGILVFIHDKEPKVTELLHQRLQRNIPEAKERILFLERMPESDYLSLLQLVSVLLDTLHYTGGANTCYDAFGVGTPYVTLPSEYHRGRYGFAAYQQIGVLDAVAKDEADYVRLAVEIANHSDLRKNIAEKIVANRHKVFEDMEAVRELEAFFEKALKP